MAKLFKFMGLTLLALVLTGAGWLAQMMVRFDLQLDPVAGPIIRHDGPWGERVPLIPNPIHFDSPIEQVRERLEKSRFEKLEKGDDTIRPRDRDIEGPIYRREFSGFPCNEEMIVVLNLSPDKTTVMGAEGALYERGCL